MALSVADLLAAVELNCNKPAFESLLFFAWRKNRLKWKKKKKCRQVAFFTLFLRSHWLLGRFSCAGKNSYKLYTFLFTPSVYEQIKQK